MRMWIWGISTCHVGAVVGEGHAVQRLVGVDKGEEGC